MPEPRARILFVDDEKFIRDLGRAILIPRGFELILAEDGHAGLLAFVESPHEIDLIVSDISMPKLTGIELAQRLFERKPHSNIILMTGYSSAAIVPDELKKICGVLQKPFTAKQLLAAVEKCLEYDRQRLFSHSDPTDPAKIDPHNDGAG